MSLDTRLDRLTPALSPRERAVLVLHTFKERKPQDYRVAQGMSPNETHEYNRLIGLMNACNMEVLMIVIMLQARASQIDLKIGWLATLEMWGQHADLMEFYLKRYTKEPIVESAYQALVSAQPERWAPVSELAEVLTSRKEDWREDQVEHCRERIVKDADWQEESKRQGKGLAALVKDGTLLGRRRGGELEIKVASFQEWLGEDVPVRPDYGFDFDVIPDEEADLADRLRGNRAELRKTFTSKAFRAPDSEKTSQWPFYRAVAAGLARRLEAEIKSTWRETTALDAAMAEVAREFGEEDPLRPDTRVDLDKVIATLKEAHAFLQEIAGEFELPELDQDEVRQNVEFIKHFASR